MSTRFRELDEALLRVIEVVRDRVAAGEMSREELVHFLEIVRERIRSLVARVGLPSELPNHPRSAYLDALRVDKKMANSKIRFVVLRGIGRAETVPLTPREVLPASRRRLGSSGARAGGRAEGESSRG